MLILDLVQVINHSNGTTLTVLDQRRKLISVIEYLVTRVHTAVMQVLCAVKNDVTAYVLTLDDICTSNIFHRMSSRKHASMFKVSTE